MYHEMAPVCVPTTTTCAWLMEVLKWTSDVIASGDCVRACMRACVCEREKSKTGNIHTFQLQKQAGRFSWLFLGFPRCSDNPMSQYCTSIKA